MAKTIKYCPDCECSHAMGECGTERAKPSKRERRKQEIMHQEYYSFLNSDPLSMDP